MKTYKSLLESLIIGLAGGFLFSFLQLPLAWMLGSLLATVIWKLWMKREAVLLQSMRNGSLVVIGYMLGISFTYETLKQMMKMLPAMLMITLLLIGASIVISIFLAKFIGISFKTALIGMMPGGFSQMVILGEEMKDVDVTSVTLFQLIRLLAVIYLVPAIVRFDWFTDDNIAGSFLHNVKDSSTLVEVILFIAVTITSMYLAVKLKVPTPYLVGPIFGCAFFTIIGIKPFVLPELALIAAQLFLGIHIGKMVDPSKLLNWKRFGIGAVISSIILISSTVLISYILVWLYPISSGTAFLSSSPGGIAEMGLTAVEIGADLSIVTGFQIFRIFFILFLVPPIMIWIFQRKSRQNQSLLKEGN